MIKKYLELCTSHLTEETVNSLNTVQPPYSYQYPYGVFIIVPDRSSEEEFADFFQALPNDLQIVLKYAYEHDIEFINSRAGNSTRKSDIGEIADETNTRISDAA